MGGDEDKPPLFDDPEFLQELADLDRGLTASARTADTTAAAAPSPPAASRTRHRPIIDLFPPPAAPTTATPTAPAERVPAPRADRASPPYVRLYGFAEPPFALAPDPRFLFHSRTHDAAMTAIVDALGGGPSVAVVLGELGLGKTLLCRALTSRLDARTLVSLVTAPIASAADLLIRLLVDFGVATREDVRSTSVAALRDALRSFLASLSRIPAAAVIVVDDAHRLSSEVLEELQRLLTTDTTGDVIRLVLVGEPTMLDVFGRRELSPLERRMTIRACLDPLARDEVSAYIAHRLATAGRPRVDFEDQAVQAVSEFSGGVPALINAICDRALTRAAERSASAVDVGCVVRAAEDLGLTPEPIAQGLAVPAGAAVIVLSLLVTLGSVGSAYVFRDRVRNGVIAWQAVPALPAAPTLPQSAPLRPLPLPADL